MPAPRAVLVLAVATALGTALGTAGCGRTVAGSAEPAPGLRPGAVAAAAAPRGVGCPSVATLREALPRDGAGGTYRLTGPVLCSGAWAVANPQLTAPGPQGEEQPVSVTQLFHRVGDGWQAVDRTPPCSDGDVPADIYELTCDSN